MTAATISIGDLIWKDVSAPLSFDQLRKEPIAVLCCLVRSGLPGRDDSLGNKGKNAAEARALRFSTHTFHAALKSASQGGGEAAKFDKGKRLARGELPKGHVLLPQLFANKQASKGANL